MDSVSSWIVMSFGIIAILGIFGYLMWKGAAKSDADRSWDVHRYFNSR